MTLRRLLEFVIPGRDVGGNKCPGRGAACNAAPQSRDICLPRKDDGPRISSATLRVAQHPGNAASLRAQNLPRHSGARAKRANPESGDSGPGPSDHPGMTA